MAKGYFLKSLLTVMAIMTAMKCAFAQGVLKGEVIDEADQRPIEFSNITLYKESDSTSVSGSVSDAQGRFIIRQLQEGKYVAVITFLGLEPKRIENIVVKPDEILNLGQITLSAREKLLNEIEVTGQKSTLFHQIDKQVYNAAAFGAAQGGNAIEALRSLPAVSVNAEGEITLRGSTGFIILLDGKATQADPLVILNQLPSNAIENIEIITTPSSRFDPDGKAGIINIQTRKGTTDGYYVLANVQGGLPSMQDYGNENYPLRFGGDITSNIKTGKWNISLSANYKRDDVAGYRNGEAETRIQDVFTTFPSVGERSYRNYSYGVRTSAAFQLDKNNVIEAGFYGGKKTQYRKADILYSQKRFRESTGEEINELEYFNKNLRERKGDFAVANLDYTHTFKNKGSLTSSVLYEKTILGGPTRNTDVNPENKSQVYNDAVMQESNPLDGVRIKSDYSLPVGKKGKFEAGYQYRYLLHKGNFEYTELDDHTGNWFVREDLSNRVRLTRNIHALYGQFSNQAGNLSYSGGLRLEYVDRLLKDQNVAEPYRFERLNLFPSANVLYTLPEGYSLKAGYSRRISHTTSNMMNPFPARRHSEVFEIGDPRLLPEYIDVAEIGAVKDIGNSSVFMNFYHRNTKNVINRVNTVYNDTILYRTFTNSGDARSFGIEAGLDLKLTDWWTLFAGGNIYQYTIRGSVYQAPVHTRSVNYSINANTTFLIQPSLTLQLTVNYTSKTVTAQGEDSEFLIPSLTLKKLILKGQGSFSLQWQNIDMGWLTTNEQRITTQAEGFYTSTNYIYEVDVLRVNFSYQLNKLAKKIKFTESEFGEKEF